MIYFRPIYMMLNALMLEFYLYINVFKHRRHLWVLPCVALARIFGKIYVGQYLYSLYGKEVWVLQLDWFLATLYIMMLVGGLIYMFHDEETSILKVLFMNMIVDMLVGVVYSLLLVFINVLSGRAALDSINGLWMMPDLLVVLFTVGAFYLIKRFGQDLFAIFQDFEITHVTLITILSLSYILLGVTTSINLTEAAIYSFGYVVYVLYAIFLLGLMIYDNRMMAHNKHLDDYSQMLQLHYQLMSAHMVDLSLQQQEIDTMMAQLEANDFPPDRTRDYLERLVAQKDVLHTTMFTDYYIVDALLTAKAHDYTHSGISYQFNLTDLKLEHMSQFTLCEYLMLLFEYAASLDIHDISLRLGSLHEQIIIDLRLDQPLNKRHIRSLFKGYGHHVIYDVADKTLTMAIADED